MKPNIVSIIFDFDGVLTDDRVWVDQDGREMVCCSRKDGIGFDILKKSGIQTFILSTETNPVVSKRAEKLKIPAHQGCRDKSSAVTELSRKHGFALSDTLYVGNDVNDLAAMKICGYSACPADAHEDIKASATFLLSAPGGGGVVRDIIQNVLFLNEKELWA
jgi:3-deoxy-D-manno-octulosonate 8-phosphate phosphatase (KDO 8-P phosphatase)